MSKWQMPVEKQLASHDAPPVLTTDLLKRFSQAANNNRSVAVSSLTYWKNTMVAEAKLQPVQRGLFLNRFRSKSGTLSDACFWYHPDAVVSLSTVLGDSGVLNNPSTVVTALVPIDRGANPPSRLGRKQTAAGIIHFFGVPRKILEAGEAEDRLDKTDLYEHLRATPEKALIDWIYLGRSPRSRRTMPPRSDIDIRMLNARRLNRLGKASGLDAALHNWLLA
jgi:hypothetical protein